MENSVLFISNKFVFLSVTYLLFGYHAFILKVKQSGTDQRAGTLYRFLNTLLNKSKSD